MSIAVPFLFSSFKYGPWNYFDGGTVESSPCGHLIGHKSEDVLIIKLIYKDAYNVNNFSDYLNFVFNTYLKMRKIYKFPSLEIDLSESNVLDFGISDTVKLEFYLKGYNYFHI
jgi:predicted acylesterase/phospholipase RssA